MATLDSDDLQAISDLIDERLEAFVVGLIIEGPNQLDGGGEAGTDGDDDVTLLEGLRGILAYATGDATGLEGPTGILKSRKGGRNRAVFALANGNRSASSRDES